MQTSGKRHMHRCEVGKRSEARGSDRKRQMRGRVYDAKFHFIIQEVSTAHR